MSTISYAAAITNSGRLTVTPVAALIGTYGLSATIVNSTSVYVRDDTPISETHYRARFYFDPNSVTMAANDIHDIFTGRNTAGDYAFHTQLRFSSLGQYQVNADIRDNTAGHHTTAWYAISDASHFIEIEWFAATAPGANNGYLSLWIDGALKETVSGINNDTRRVDEVRLGPLGGLDPGTSGTEYFDAFESRRQTYIGPAGPLADFTASPVQGIAPLTVTFTNTSQPTSTITAYVWNFGDGYTSTITNPVHSYLANGFYSVSLTAFTTVTQNTLTKTNFITASDLIFADGFESGNFAAWSAAITNSGHLTVSPAAALVGNYGLQATIVNTTAMYVRDDTPAGEARYRARFYFDPNSITMASGNEHIIFEGETAADVDAFRVWFRFSGGAYQLHAKLIDDGSTYTSTAYYTITDAPHFIETDWAAATAPGANNGYLSLWIDGVFKETVSGINNDTLRIDDVRLGPSSGINAGTSGTEYFDALESRRQSYIGPASSGVTLTTSTIRYTYDPLSRLTGATYSGAYTYTFAYVYDQVGNRTAQTATITSTMVTTYTYDAANRLMKVGNTNTAWDNNGNLTNDGSGLYRYDQANRLISTTIGTTTTLYSYNGDGVRLKQIIAGVPTTYTQDLAAPLSVVLQAKTGTIATQYLYNIGPRPLAQYTSSTWQYLLPDALGSVRQIADASGNILLTESYQPYGTLLNSSGSGSSIFGYSGEQFDTTGLIYLRARYMNPTLGIFLARDPWSGDVLRPGSMNGWNYASENPINVVDPTGQVQVRIWAAAFIEPQILVFPYYYVSPSLFPPTTAVLSEDPWAQWHGDGREFYNGSRGTFAPKQPRPSSRVWHDVVLDLTPGDARVVFNNTGIGETRVTFVNTRGQTATDRNTAPKSPEANITTVGDLTNVDIAARASNPLSPPGVGAFNSIIYNYHIVFDRCAGTVSYSGSHTEYPWHELYISGLEDRFQHQFTPLPDASPYNLFKGATITTKLLSQKIF